VWSLKEVEVGNNKFTYNMTEKVNTSTNDSNCVNVIERDSCGAELSADYS